MTKDVIVNLSTDTNDDVAVAYAISLAREFEAHLTAIALVSDTVPTAMVVEGLPPVLIEEMQEKAQEEAQAAVAKFHDAARGSGISSEAHWLTIPYAGAAGLFGRIARRFDLAVVRQPEPAHDMIAPLIVEAALFESGRPVLIVPYIQRGGLKLDRVMVAWDGSRSAARAVGDALPFLKRAKTVNVVIVGREVKSGEIPGADIAHHLARHGANVEVKEIVAADIDAANVLLSYAADLSVDFLVMGGYGHSRLREFVLGGVTRSILATMTIPTLMSH